MENSKTQRKAQVKLLKEQAYEIIKEDIINGYYKPGDELREANLSDELGMSKTPIREALIQLQNEGFVEIRPFRGAVVTDISIEDVVKLYEFREIIETYAIKIAAETCEPSDIEYLKKQIKVMENALKEGIIDEYDNAHNNFHHIIISKTKNKWINRALANMEDYVRRVRKSIIKNEQISFINDYEQLLNALERKDANLASKIIKEHLTRVVENFKKHKS
ncbi:GntR family transcriptional regulator [Desulfallas sp. Bu1-1]|uniref:GntR family transcriptional regulator n=1 Tax=Desulfallas sp. Bu1-1 TaxID=2787620 RepID=UPI00189DE0A4|nr:GntR family transcriptional regulator [Desulfallas sp. Bu1-1]MBF7083400.1 GntR family transcriptional regulator [Desulfallas sp. Bu1-1]